MMFLMGLLTGIVLALLLAGMLFAFGADATYYEAEDVSWLDDEEDE
jgi:hypothetical protein